MFILILYTEIYYVNIIMYSLSNVSFIILVTVRLAHLVYLVVVQVVTVLAHLQGHAIAIILEVYLCKCGNHVIAVFLDFW